MKKFISFLLFLFILVFCSKDAQGAPLCTEYSWWAPVYGETEVTKEIFDTSFYFDSTYVQYFDFCENPTLEIEAYVFERGFARLDSRSDYFRSNLPNNYYDYTGDIGDPVDVFGGGTYTANELVSGYPYYVTIYLDPEDSGVDTSYVEVVAQLGYLWPVV